MQSSALATPARLHAQRSWHHLLVKPRGNTQVPFQQRTTDSGAGGTGHRLLQFSVTDSTSSRGSRGSAVVQVRSSLLYHPSGGLSNLSASRRPSFTTTRIS